MHTAIETMKVVVQAVSEAAGPERTNGAANAACMSARTSGPALKQPTFNWNAQEKCNKLLNFEMEVQNIFMTKSYDISDILRVSIIMNWLGCEGFHFV